jgi:sugar fermentation stimulation protein A
LTVNEPLLEGFLVRRYKRFLMDIRLDGGRVVTVHCPNSGSMTGCLKEGARVLASPSRNPKRKLSHTAEWIQMEDGWVGINTHLSNKIVGEALRAGAVPELSGYDEVRAERPYGRCSRADFLLSASGRRDCYVEVKNTTLPGREQAVAFPDAVTLRGQKHLDELMDAAGNGKRAVMFFLVNRPGGRYFKPARTIDPVYAAKLAAAAAAGVEVLSYRSVIEPPTVVLGDAVPVRL